MGIINKVQQENLEYIFLENFIDVLDFSLSGTGYSWFYLLPILLDKGLQLSHTESGYIFDEQMAFKGDIKCALKELTDKLFDTDVPINKLYKEVIVKSQDGLEISLSKLFVKKSHVEKAYEEYGETKYPWALTFWPQTDNEWDWFSVNQMMVSNKELKLKIDIVPEIETSEDTGADKQTFKARSNGYKARDEFVIELIKDKPGLLTLRAGEIKKILQKASNLFSSGYPDWWRYNPIFKKDKGGRHKLIRNKNS